MRTEKQWLPAGPADKFKKNVSWLDSNKVRLVSNLQTNCWFGFLTFQGMRSSEFSVNRGGPGYGCREVYASAGPLNFNFYLECANGAERTKPGACSTLTDEEFLSFLTLGISDLEGLGHVHVVAELPGPPLLCLFLVGERQHLRPVKRSSPWCRYLSQRNVVIHRMWTLLSWCF